MHGILWGIVEDKAGLLAKIPNRFKKIFPPHLTLRFNAALTKEQQLFLETSFQVRIIADAWNGEIQAAKAEILDPQVAALCENKQPHITISSNGASPVKSNAMFAGSHDEQPIDFTIELVIKYWTPGSKDVETMRFDELASLLSELDSVGTST